MKIIGLLFMVLAVGVAQDDFDGEDEVVIDLTDFDLERFLNSTSEFLPSAASNGHEITPRGPLVSWKARQELRDIQKRFPCGWPQYGVPPLAPYRKDRIHVELKKFFLDTITNLVHFKLEGLDKFEIKKFHIGLIAHKVKFNFNFPKLRVLSKYDTNFFVDLMKYFGVDIRYEGAGDLDFRVSNLNVRGSIKYKMPVLFGSAKLSKFKCQMSVENVWSNIMGLVPSVRMNRFINDQIEDIVSYVLNNSDDMINKVVNEVVLPEVNVALRGDKIWTLLKFILHGGLRDDGPCIAPPDPWARP